MEPEANIRAEVNIGVETSKSIAGPSMEPAAAVARTGNLDETV